jgi:DNA-binding NtrC family response regulator
VSLTASPERLPLTAITAFPVLLVEDKDSLRTMLRAALETQGHTVVEARDEPEAIDRLRQLRPAVVLTDLKLPSGDGFGVLRAAKAIDPDLQVVVMTAFGSIQDAVTAMKDGAMDFLAKPFDPEHLLVMVDRAIAQRRILAEYLSLKEEAAERRGAPRIVGDDVQLRHVLQQLHRAATTDATVLVEGESGTGKELFARALHAWSPRADGPFVAINCAAIPEGLLESELFGHEKGAFTGAVARKPGRFEMAHRGTLFLDEIGDMPLGLQAKILRALETKEIQRVGGTASLHVDTRVVAATNRGLKEAVAARQFREDLYFRLSVFPITVPPLRTRPGDVPVLARHFVERFCRDLNKKSLYFSPSAVETLRAYHWPGNVRELQNCIERAVILCDGDHIEARHLNLTVPRTPPAQEASSPANQPNGPSILAPESRGGVDPGTATLGEVDLAGTLGEAVRRATAEVERIKVRQALRDAKGDKGRAAGMLQISYRAFLQKQRDHAIPD